MKTASLYTTHCKAFTIAREVLGDGFVTHSADHPYYSLHCKQFYRNPEHQWFRNEVARRLRLDRQLVNNNPMEDVTTLAIQFTINNDNRRGFGPGLFIQEIKNARLF